MPQAATLRVLERYTPSLLRRLLTDSPVVEPLARQLSAAVLFADISGFTKLTEKMAGSGPAGAEELAHLLNSYFGQLIELIDGHGGEVLKFAGDATLALWPAATPEELTSAVRHAGRCALAVQEAHAEGKALGRLALRSRIGIGAGQVTALCVGGVQDRWELLVAGDPLTQMSTAADGAAPGEVALSHRAWTLLGAQGLGEPVPSGCRRLLEVSGPRPRPGDAASETSLPEAVLRPFIPRSILSRIDAGHTEWSAEFRRANVLFVNLRGIDFEDEEALDRLQAGTRELQTAVYHFDGSVNQFVIDDKGLTLVAGWGLPMLTHENDAERAVEAALGLQSKLPALGFDFGIGLATGRVFCFQRGNDLRCEYAMIGDVVNLAARMMQASSNSVLCDAATRESAQATTRDPARSQLRFESLPALELKGKTRPVAAFRPFREQRSHIRQRAVIVGRRKERGLLQQKYGALRNGGASATILIEGEAGIGKSYLAESLLQEVREAPEVSLLIGAGDEIDQATPYFAWRSIYARLFELPAVADDPRARRQHVLAQLEAEPQMLRLAPLLNSVLPLDHPDNEITAQMNEEVRADNTRDLLLRLLANRAAAAPLVLVLEDGHWLDSASWGLARRASQQLQHLLLIVTTRPLSEPLPTGYSQWIESENLTHIRLETLPAEETLALVRQRLGVAALPTAVERLILEKAEGHPFFSEELAYALRDSKRIVVSGGECRLATDSSIVEPEQLLRKLDFPDTVQGIIASRVDRLNPQEQLALKIASVLGRHFTLSALREIYPIERDRDQLDDFLQDLQRLEIVTAARVDSDLAYSFRHAITQEVCYDLLPFAQKQQLHKKAAERIERHHGYDLRPHYPLLAHHWREANVLSKAVGYFARAGRQALDSFANREAVRCYGEALDLDRRQRMKEEGRLSPDDGSVIERQAVWKLRQGRALVNWNKHTEARECLEEGLKLLSWPMPSSEARAAGALLGQLFRQSLHRLSPQRFVGSRPHKRERLLEAARAFEGLVEAYYHLNEKLHTLLSAFYSMNLAELAGPSPELTRSYATVGSIFGFIPLNRLADAYCHRAAQTAQSLDNLSARAWVGLATGVYSLRVGRVSKARELFEQVLAIADELGDRRRRDDSVENLAAIAYLEGRFEQGLRLGEQLYRSGIERADVRYQVDALRRKIWCLLPLDELDEVLSCVSEIDTVASGDLTVEDEDRAELHSFVSMVHLRKDDPSAALEHARKAARLMQSSSRMRHDLHVTYAGIAEVFVRLLEADPDRADVLSSTQRACRALRAYAKVFPLARPQALLWNGVAAWLAGKSRAAHRSWQKGLDEAERLNMPYYRALLKFEIGRHLERADQRRSQHLQESIETFSHLGSVYYRKQTEAALAGL